MQDEIIVIGSWEDAESRPLRLRDFAAEGDSFIPIFLMKRRSSIKFKVVALRIAA